MIQVVGFSNYRAIDLVAPLERDFFQGMPRLRLRLVDYADAAASPLAERRNVAIALSRQSVVA